MMPACVGGEAGHAAQCNELSGQLRSRGVDRDYRLVWAFSVSSTARSKDEVLAGAALRFLSAT